MKAKITRTLKRGYSRSEADRVVFGVRFETKDNQTGWSYESGEFNTYEDALKYAKEYKAHYSEEVVEI